MSRFKNFLFKLNASWACPEDSYGKFYEPVFYLKNKAWATC
ncbi:hypothetical protein ZPR_3028 [Zunongwangia profunda SM-A87]|uniref:Uncharacterized protein n=1 Tax=Zunongwangia profunda (strain DSM 18752 / CCTCC AB 206139 / SM-A87) TaxID=655815 RepID=D5BHE9_ZUNPS|nr:hypothetical protein ZPR_3028 [Zunongwangia profunda SM-A87]